MPLNSIADGLIPQAVIDKINTPETVASIQRLMTGLTVFRKAQISTDNFVITAYVVKPEQGQRAVCIRIEEG